MPKINEQYIHDLFEKIYQEDAFNGSDETCRGCQWYLEFHDGNGTGDSPPLYDCGIYNYLNCPKIQEAIDIIKRDY